MSSDPPNRPRPDWIPLIVLAGAVVLGLLAWRLYPLIAGWLSFQDCVATGRVNCAGIGR